MRTSKKFLLLLGVFVFGVALVLGGLRVVSQKSVVAHADNENGNGNGNSFDLTGEAWAGTSDAGPGAGVGWVSFNSKNCDTNGNGVMDAGDTPTFSGCPAIGSTTPRYWVNVDKQGSSWFLSGHAWSPTLGWISFDKDDIGDDKCPSTVPSNPNCQPQIDSGGTLSGWARVCGVAEGSGGETMGSGNGTHVDDCSRSASTNRGEWDGWISLKGKAQDGTTYGVFASSTPPGIKECWSGQAWGGDAAVVSGSPDDRIGVGWLSFAGTSTPTTNYAVGGPNCNVPASTINDFALSSRSATVLVDPGVPAVNFIDVSTVQGAPGLVTLVAATEIQNGTVQLTPDFKCTPTPNCSETITVNVPSLTEPGTYTVWVWGTSPNVSSTRLTTFSVIVKDTCPGGCPSRFRMHAESPWVQGDPRTAVSNLIDITKITGSPRSVLLSAIIDDMAGATISFSPPSCVPTCSPSPRLTIGIPLLAKQGFHMVRVTGVSANATPTTRHTSFLLEVMAGGNPLVSPDFTMIPDPTSISADPGATVTDTVHIIPVSGAPDAVTLTTAISPLIPGGTVVANPVSCTPSCDSVVSVTVPAGTPDGQYTVTITGTSPGSPAHTITIPLQVITPDYAMTVEKTTVSGNPGGPPVVNTVDLTPISDTPGPVDITATTDLPVGTPPPTVSLSPCTPQCSSDISVVILRGTPPGPYTVTISGTSADGTPPHTITFGLQVNAVCTPNPSCPALCDTQVCPVPTPTLRIEPSSVRLILGRIVTYQLHAFYDDGRGNQNSRSDVTTDPNTDWSADDPLNVNPVKMTVGNDTPLAPGPKGLLHAFATSSQPIQIKAVYNDPVIGATASSTAFIQVVRSGITECQDPSDPNCTLP